MAVETRYVVIRKEGAEVMTFTDKKSADEYDRMLDMADALIPLIEKSQLKIEAEQLENFSVYLAQNREELLYALQAKKRPNTDAKVAAKKSPKNTKKSGDDLTEDISEQGKSANTEKEKVASAKPETANTDDKASAQDFIIEKEEAA